MNGYQVIGGTGQIERKTEKALLVRVTTTRGERDVWFPRSQIVIENRYIHAKDWIVEAKGRDVAPIITIDPRMVEAA